MPPSKFLQNIFILPFERRVSKQNSVIRLKSNILPLQISGLATPLDDLLVMRRKFERNQTWQRTWLLKDKIVILNPILVHENAKITEVSF